MSDGETKAVPRAIVIGGGPAGLMAAQTLVQAGVTVDLFDAIPSVGRKLLLAGKGGLNLSHAEPALAFAARYGGRRAAIEPLLTAFGADAVRAWAQGLGIETFVGSSGRIFPRDLKAAPLLRAWLQRLRAQGVRFHMRHRWLGFAAAAGGGSPAPVRLPLRFATPQGEHLADTADAVVLALGGGSWPQLGSTGAWVPWLREQGVDVAPLQPANCGFDVARVDASGALQPGWTPLLRSRFAGAALKNISLRCDGPDGAPFQQAGECVVTAGGVEGSLIYAAAARLRDTIALHGRAVAFIDLLPAHPTATVQAEVARPRGSRSLATHLKSRLGIDGVKAALLYELLPREVLADPLRLAPALKALPLHLIAPRPLAEAISSAGGVRFEALEGSGMLRALPGVFCAGEMLDWEAPTGGYLLTACLASGLAAGRGALAFLQPAQAMKTP